MPNAGEDPEQLELSLSFIHCQWKCKILVAQILENSLQSLYKATHIFLMGPRNPTPGYFVLEIWKIRIHTKSGHEMFIAKAFIIAKSGNSHSVYHEWMSKHNVVQPYNGIPLSNERNKHLIHPTTCRTLRGILWNERNQSSKATQCIIPFIWYFQKDKSIATENISVFAKSQGYREAIKSLQRGCTRVFWGRWN